MANAFDQFDTSVGGTSTPSLAPQTNGPLSEADLTTSTPSDFKAKYGTLAARVGKELDVDPSLILGQWGLETGWGRHVIPGTNNLGNIKDLHGRGPSATDNQTGSTDTYRQFDTPEDFGQHYIDLIQRKYPGVIGAGKDSDQFARGLSGYAEDPSYGSKLTSASRRVGSVDPAPNSFDQFDPNPFSQFDANLSQINQRKPTPITGAPKQTDVKSPQSPSLLRRAAGNVAAGADVIAGLPGAILGPVASATGRWVAIAMGAQGEDISKFGHQFGETVQENLSSPVKKLLDLAGVDVNYDKSGVQQALTKAGEIIGKGAGYLTKASGGVINQEDAQDITNAASMALIPGAIKLTAKGLMASGVKLKGTPGETATLRETDAPAPPQPGESPEAAAKRTIEATTGVDRAKTNSKAYRQQAMADARVAFSDDAEFTRYAKTYALSEATTQGENYEKANAQDAKTTQNPSGTRDPNAQVSQEQTRPVGQTFTEGSQEDQKTGILKSEGEQVTQDEAQKIMATPSFDRTSEQIIRLRAYGRQGGQVDPKLLASMAAIGLGIGAGVALDQDDPMMGALVGGLGGAFGKVALQRGIPAASRELSSMWKERRVFKPDERLRITDIANDHEVSIARATRSVMQAVDSATGLVPDKGLREPITHWMQGNKTIKLTDAQYKVATQMRSFFDQAHRDASSVGVLNHYIQDYVTNLWDLEGSNKTRWTQMTSSMSPKSKFDLQRKISSLEAGKQLGLKPVTEDIAAIAGIYGNSLYRTIANRQLIDALKQPLKGTEGQSFVMPSGTAPRTYTTITHPQLQGLRVHPDITKSMEFLFNQKTPSGITAALQGLNMAVKRSELEFSLFHAKSLVDAYIGARGLHAFTEIPGIVRGTNQYLRMLHKGGQGDIADKGLQGGLKLTMSSTALADEDVGGNFYPAMQSASRIANEAVPGLGRVVDKYVDANKAFDHFMWGRLHTGMKLTVFAKTHEILTRNNLASHQRDPSIALKSDLDISKIAASFTNDIFGGLNWRRIAEGTKTQWGRDAALTLLKPSSRAGLQLLTFAPDWTLSTTRAFVKAFGKGSGMRGLISPTELADLHRQYLIRSAAYYFTVGNGINYALTGHSILENKDPTMIELGNGEKIPFSKHAMEPFKWMTEPGQEALNKMGVLPSEALDQITGKEYLSTKGAPAIKGGTEGRLKHAGKRLLPMPFQQGVNANTVSSTLGFPIYGKTKEEAAVDKRERAAEAKATREEHKKKNPFKYKGL